MTISDPHTTPSEDADTDSMNTDISDADTGKDSSTNAENTGENAGNSESSEEKSVRTQTSARLKVLQRDGVRVSIRMEEAFWTQLETAAREQKVKLGDLVFDIMDTAAPGDNKTSRLRTYCVLLLRQQLLRARLAANDANLPMVLAACPTPCFVINPARQLAGHNPAFAREILDDAQSEHAAPPSERVAFAFSQPFDRIRRAMSDQPDRVFFDRIGIKQGEKQIVHRVSLCLLSRKLGADSPVLAFVMAK